MSLPPNLYGFAVASPSASMSKFMKPNKHPLAVAVSMRGKAQIRRRNVT
ncbi:MAG: hypothetical protein LBQ90_03155 [Synergistaceae bacterium]|nr:hypothetical protein [Synergistaceae bacterium]